jgi:Family of unknown function (DUF6152)
LGGTVRDNSGPTIGAAQLPPFSTRWTQKSGRTSGEKRGESMTRKLVMIVILGSAIAVACRPALAHHGAAAYDTTKTVTLKGTVAKWLWSNPHCLLLLDATDDNGQVVHWIAETQNPLSMSNMGWANDSFKPGDHITLRVTPSKNGTQIGLVVDVVLANGHKLNARNFVADEPKTDASPKQ